jgi:hypothetical protein
MPITSVSSFNEVASEMKKLSSDLVSFFNELEIKKPCSKTYVPFFNEVSSEIQKNYPRNSLLDHGFQEDKALEGHHVKGQKSVMASKRSSLEGRNTLWKNTMSSVATGVRRSTSNSPTKEITMSTTGSKSSEIETMGENTT